MTRVEFIKKAIKNGVDNDSTNVWVTVDGNQYNVEHNIEEKEPFEVSEMLENDMNNDLWDDLYNEYLDSLN